VHTALTAAPGPTQIAAALSPGLAWRMPLGPPPPPRPPQRMWCSWCLLTTDTPSTAREARGESNAERCRGGVGRRAGQSSAVHSRKASGPMLRPQQTRGGQRYGRAGGVRAVKRVHTPPRVAVSGKTAGRQATSGRPARILSAHKREAGPLNVPRMPAAPLRDGGDMKRVSAAREGAYGHCDRGPLDPNSSSQNTSRHNTRRWRGAPSPGGAVPRYGPLPLAPPNQTKPRGGRPQVAHCDGHLPHVFAQKPLGKSAEACRIHPTSHLPYAFCWSQE